MTFQALTEQHARFTGSHGPGETVNLRLHLAGAWTTGIPAVVDRNPIDAVGQYLENTAEVVLSAADYPKATIGKDELQLPKDQLPLEAIPTYRVMGVTKVHGFRILHCERVSQASG